MQKGWVYVPYDMPGDFLQSIPIPDSQDSFICVQPICHQDLEGIDNEVVGYVDNKDHMPEEQKGNQRIINEKNRQEIFQMRKTTVETSESQNKDIQVKSDDYSILSIWKYMGADNKTFDCVRSFTTHMILSFQDACGKKHKRRYLFVGHNNQIFFFQEE